MKSFIVYEKDKNLAEFLAIKHMEENGIKKPVLKRKRIEEISSTTLFTLPDDNSLQENNLFDNIDDFSDDNEIWPITSNTNLYPDEDLTLTNNSSPWEINNNTVNNGSHVNTVNNETIVYMVSIVNKEDSERVMRLIENGELSHRLSSGSVYCFVFSYVFDNHFRVIVDWVVSQGVDLVTPVVSGQYSYHQLITKFLRDYGFNNSQARIVLSCLGDNFGLVVPFLNSLVNSDYRSFVTSLDDDDFSQTIRSFFPVYKSDSLFLWDWKKCLQCNNFEDFSRSILRVEKVYGDVVLLRNMYKTISEWGRVKQLQESGLSLDNAANMVKGVRIDYYAKIVLGNKNISTHDMTRLVGIVYDAYDNIMSGKQNKKTLMSTMIIKMWYVFKG